jgi:putative protease
VDALGRGATPADEQRAREDLLRTGLAYTRGFSDGFLGGSDHQTLVEGRFPKHRGIPLGRVVRVVGDSVLVERDDEIRPWTGALAADVPRRAPEGVPSAARTGLGGSGTASDGPAPARLDVRAGMGVVFDAGRSEDEQEPGGPVFRVDATEHGWRLGFGRPGPDLSRVVPGDRVWVTSDPTIARETERTVGGEAPSGRIPLGLSISGRAGAPLVVEACARHAGTRVESASPLVPATGGGLAEPLLREKVGATGGTPFRLDTLDLSGLAPGLHLPVSELKDLRRRLVEALLPAVERGPERVVAAEHPLPALLVAARAASGEAPPLPAPAPLSPPLPIPLCRDDAHLEAAIDAGLLEVELDWMEMVGLAKAVARARAAGLRVTLATVRVQKPGEEGFDARLAALEPDGVLVRHWGAMVHFLEAADRGAGREGAPVLHGDFSLNVTNSLTAGELLRRGLTTLTLSHDLDPRQTAALLDATDPSRFTIVLHHRLATFHTEHCVYSHLLSAGRDFRTCGRPCERHRVALRDTRGREHPVIVDVGCRNTVFHAEPTAAAAIVPDALARGVRRFRVELVRESREEARSLFDAYTLLLAGRIDPREAIARTGAVSQLGVSPVPMAAMA